MLLFRSWKKQLVIAKDARRLDVLCHRIFLSHKILISTQKYLVLHEVVDTALQKLEGELGSITGLPDKGRGIVGRLTVGAEVQKLCTRAIATLESMLSGALTADRQIQSKFPHFAFLQSSYACNLCECLCITFNPGSHMVPSDFIKLEDISHESITVVFDLDVCPMLSRGLTGFNLWHRKASEEDYPSILTGIIPIPSRMLVVRGLAPCTSYVIKVVAFTSSKKIGSWEVRTNTIGCPKGLGAKDSMPVDVGKDPDSRSAKENSSGLSNPSSEGVESDEVSTDYADLNSSSESDVERCKSLDVLYSVKPHHCNETTSYSRDRNIDVAGVSKVDDLGEAPRVSASDLDDNEQEPGSVARAALLKKSAELMACSQRDLKQNSGMVGSEIAPHSHTGNKSVAPPEYHGSVLHIIQKETENYKGVSGMSFEAKSDNHVPQDGSSKTETDLGCLSHKYTPRRVEDDGHKDGPSEPNTSAQVSSLQKSSNLVLHKQGILLENAPGSLAPITGNGIKSGNRIMGTNSKSKMYDHVPQPRPLKPGTEPGSSSSKHPSGKPEDNEQVDSNAYVFCVKVIWWLECEGHIEANFRMKFLTWLSLRATQQEKRIVSVFVDTLIDDPASLAGQLIDTFSEAIYSKRPPVAP